MSDSVLEEFDRLCKSVAAEAAPTLGEDELEPLYERVLNFLAKNEDRRAALSQRLIDVMAQYRFARDKPGTLLPSTAIAYSMHELRWPEVRAFAERENAAFYSPKRATLMTDILSAYSDEWEDREFYRRFQKSA